eukprot:SM000112S23985  [mRNA]  locus=s112:152406:153303:- [translate_table: standard]
MTNTWRRSPGAQPPHQQRVRRFGGNVRQRSASSALRLPQGGSRDFAGGWTGIQFHRRFLNSSKEHCRSPRRLDRPSVAPPIPELTPRALPFSQVLLQALCRQFASFAGMPSHMPVVSELGQV